jgi:hypothetical protein
VADRWSAAATVQTRDFMDVVRNFLGRYEQKEMSLEDYLDLCKCYSMTDSIGEPEVIDTRHDLRLLRSSPRRCSTSITQERFKYVEDARLMEEVPC